MFKRCKVAMLPTNQEAPIALGVNLFANIPGMFRGQHFHLYILSDDSIKEGDYCLFKGADRISVQTASCGKTDGFQKIIASTDTSLGLPSPSKAFIEKYVELYNKDQRITEVNVEYVTEMAALVGALELELAPKVSSDNTITIKKVKDSYSREEVIGLIKQFGEDCHFKKSYSLWDYIVNEWAKAKL